VNSISVKVNVFGFSRWSVLPE